MLLAGACKRTSIIEGDVVGLNRTQLSKFSGTQRGFFLFSQLQERAIWRVQNTRRYANRRVCVLMQFGPVEVLT